MNAVIGKRLRSVVIVSVLSFSQVSIAANNIDINASPTNTEITNDGAGSFTSNDDTANLNVGDITSALNNSYAVSVTTTGLGSNTQDGNITVNTILDFNSYRLSSLTLTALNDININFDILDSDIISSDSLTLNLNPAGVVNLNATIGEFTNTTITGGLVIGASGTYDLIHATDSLTADSISNALGGSFNYTAGALQINDVLNIGTGELLGDALTLGVDQTLQTNDQIITSGASLTQSGGSNTVVSSLTIDAGGSYILNSGNLQAASIQNDGTMNVAGAFTVDAGNSYTQSGDLTADSINADGTMSQTSGITSVTNTIAISDTGSYDLSGGTLIADDATRTGNGVFTYNGGDLTLTNGALAVEELGLLGNTVALGANQNLQTASQSVGTTDLASGTVNQTDGSNTVVGALTINTGGTYNLDGGALNTGSVEIDGAVNQTSGVHTVTGNIAVNSLGNYDLSGSGTLNSDTLSIDGGLTQSGGSNTVTGAMAITTFGDYALSAGTLDAGSLTTDGVFHQTGGFNDVSGTITIDTNGSYTLSGGSLSADTLDNSAGGTFTWTKGRLTLNSDTIVVDSTGLLGQSLTLDSTRKLRTANQTVGTAAVNSGSVNQLLSSNNTVDGVLTINAGGSYSSTSGTLTAGSIDNEGLFTHAGSAVTNITGALTLGAGSSYNQNGGNVAAGSINNAGTYNQSLGNNTVSGALTLDAGGAYNLSNGALTANNIDNSGTMTQSGGSNSVTTSLIINAGGSYALNAGTLSAGSISNNGTLTTADTLTAGDITVGTVDPMSGSITQTAGNTNITNALTINAGGNYSLDGGNLSADTLTNSGMLSQTNNADINVSSTLTMNTGSTLDLSGGYYTQLSTTTVDNSGMITQTGGLVSSSSMTINNGGSYDQSTGYNTVNGTLSINTGGSYILSGSDYYDSNYSRLSAINMNNAGTFTQDGGDSFISNVMTVDNGGSYVMNGGTLRVGGVSKIGTGSFTYTGGELLLTNSDLIVDSTSDSLLGSTVTIVNGQTFQAVNQSVGNTGAGTITQTGGYNTATNMLNIAAGGTYNLSGGTLRAADVINNGTFNYTAGSVELSNGDLLIGAGFLGTNLNILSNESFKSNNQTVDATGTVVQDGGSNQIDGILTIDTGGSYTMNGGNLSTGSIANSGSFVYTGGGVRLTNSSLAIESGGPLGSSIDILSGQTFGSVDQTVGTAVVDSGSVNQLGGSNTVDNMLTIDSGGEYTNSGGSLSVGNVMTVNTGGKYTMSGGSLVAGSVVNNGTFDYTGGAVRLMNDDLAIDSTGLLGDAINIGNYQTFGSVNQTVGTSVVNSGVITHNGGHNIIEDTLTVAAGGTYNLSGSTTNLSSNYSTLSVGYSGVGGMNVAGMVNQSGAISTMDTLTINNGGMYAQSSGINRVYSALDIETGGSYVLSGGTLDVDSIVKNGSFSFTGGYLDLGSDLTIAVGELLGENVSISSGKGLNVGGINGINIASGSSLHLNGGSIRTSTISHDGDFVFTSGSLGVNSLTVGNNELLGNSVALSSSRVLDVNGIVTVNSGADLTVTSGTSNEFNSLVNNGAVSVTGGRLNVNNVTNDGIVSIASGTTMSWRNSSAMNSYTQNSGASLIDGTLIASSVDIQGGTLSGSGTIEGDVTVSGGGQVNPGNSPGDLEIVGNFTLSANGTLVLEVGDDPLNVDGYLWDQLIAESYDLSAGDVEFSLLDTVGIDTFLSEFSIDDFLRIGDRGENFGYLEYGLLIDSISGIKFSAFDSTTSEWSKLVLDGNGSFSVSAVPVPAAVWLFGSGLLGLIAVARRKAC